MTASATWLIDDRAPLSEAEVDQLDRELADSGPGSRGAGGGDAPTLAVSIHDVVIHDTRKWFGEADVRLDALVITGYGLQGAPESFYMPRTATFARVKDADRLQLGTGGLLAFHGPASHFLDVMLMVSRDTKDSDDLSTLLKRSLQSTEVSGAIGTMLGLAVAAPQVAVVTAAIAAAGVLGDVAYRLLRRATGSTIGLYRNSHLQFRDGFGIGDHPGPPPESFRVNDLSFRYQVSLEQA
jgi:hypothetical protein